MLVRVTSEDGIGRDSFVNALLSALLVAGALPVPTMTLATTLATAAFGNELEEGTLGNLALMPLTR